MEGGPSDIWDYFDVIQDEEGETRIKCKNCNKHYEGDTSNLFTHVTNCKVCFINYKQFILHNIY